VRYVTQIIGPVLDVVLSLGKMPNIYNSLTVKGCNPAGQQINVTCLQVVTYRSKIGLITSSDSNTQVHVPMTS
jgi:hypothetical protein